MIEFSIGLAGFSGVIAVFAGRSSERRPLDLFRLRNLLMGALIPAFLAFFGLGLVVVLSDEFIAWRFSCVGAGVSYVFFIVTLLKGRASLPAEQREMVQTNVLFLALILLGILIVAQVIAATQVVAVDAFVVFYFGLISILFISVYQFVRAVLESVRLGAHGVDS